MPIVSVPSFSCVLAGWEPLRAWLPPNSSEPLSPIVIRSATQNHDPVGMTIGEGGWIVMRALLTSSQMRQGECVSGLPHDWLVDPQGTLRPIELLSLRITDREAARPAGRDRRDRRRSAGWRSG